MSAIRNRKYISQVIDFSGLNFGKGKMPTNIDAFMDFGGKAFIFIEAKYRGAKMPFGQQLAFKHLCDVAETAGTKAICIVAEHECDKDVDIGKCRVVENYYNHSWTKMKNEVDVRTFCEMFLSYVGIEVKP